MDVLAGLDPEQRAVAESLSGPVAVLAGAGTGKTRAITHRIAHACHTGAHSASTGLAVTFTTRAAGEMRQRLVGLGVPGISVRTFHGAALRQLRYFWPTAVGGEFPELVSSKARLVGRACRDVGIAATPAVVRDLAAEIEWAGSTLVTAGDYPAAALRAGRSPVGSGADALDHAGVAQAITAYQEVKSRAHAIDFEDVLLTMVALLAERPDVADAVRSRYRWFTVDEYQDITPVQERLLMGWLGDRDDVCVVGDPSQTIYSFAGAAPDSMDRFLRQWPQATEVRLVRCYRCTPQIVAVANSLVAAARRRAVAGDEPGGPAAVRLESQQPPGPPPDIVTCADDADEAATVASRIGELIRTGTPPRDIAILMRTNGASEPIEAALSEAGIPYVMRGAERFFERPEVREAVVRMRGQAAAGARGGQGSLTTLQEQVSAVLTGMGWLPAGPSGGGAARERWESLSALVALAGEVGSSGVSDLAGLVGELERRAAISHAPTPDGVTVATLHAAKGLEWPSVFIIGCAEGSIPIVYADTAERIAEERRLLYVGLTRARDRLVVTWALSRSGTGRHREPSRFLAEMRSGGGGVPAADARSGLMRVGRSGATKERRRRPPGRCRVCGASLVTAPERTLGRCRRCPGSADEQLLEQLREWRSRTAEERSVPAYVVFTDVTLTALAERLPRDAQGLLDIPGIGRAKADLYGEQLLGMIGAGGGGPGGGGPGGGGPGGGGPGGGDPAGGPLGATGAPAAGSGGEGGAARGRPADAGPER